VTAASRILLALASGSSYALAEPPFDRAPLGFVALAPLVLAALGARSSRGALGLGWLAGTAAATPLVASSVTEAAERYFGAPPATAWLAGVLAPQLYAAPYFAAFAWLARTIARRHRGPVATSLGIAAAWVACELARSRVGDGCPWVLLAHTQHAHPEWLQVADLGGAAAVSFVLATTSTALALAVVAARDGAGRRGGALLRLGALVAVVAGGALLYGRAQLARWSSAAPDATLRVAVVQPALPDAWRLSLARVRDGVERASTLTRETHAAAPALVVWPENAISVSPDALRMVDRAAEVVPRDAALLLGAPRVVQSAPGRAVVHNAAYLLDRAGHSRPVHEKIFLTPWAEAAPWPLSWLPGAWPAAPGDYAPGRARDELPEVRGHRFGVTICSEVVYASAVRTQVRAGATFLVNLANDAWFGDRPAVEQHAAAALLRAVENRRALVRATTTGISMVADPTGRVIARAPRGRAAAFVADVPVLDAVAPYTRVGDAFAWGCVVLAVASLAPGTTLRAPWHRPAALLGAPQRPPSSSP